MHRLFELGVYTLLGSVFTITSVKAEIWQVERGSFLRFGAVNQDQMLRQVRSEPVVMARYERHFGIGPASLVHWFKSLRMISLAKGASFAVWHVNPDGQIGARPLHFSAGTRVYVDAKGRPILKLSCGNPLVPQSAAPKPLQAKIATTLVAPMSQENWSPLRTSLDDSEPRLECLDVTPQPPENLDLKASAEAGLPVEQELPAESLVSVAGALNPEPTWGWNFLTWPVSSTPVHYKPGTSRGTPPVAVPAPGAAIVFSIALVSRAHRKRKTNA